MSVCTDVESLAAGLNPGDILVEALTIIRGRISSAPSKQWVLHRLVAEYQERSSKGTPFQESVKLAAESVVHETDGTEVAAIFVEEMENADFALRHLVVEIDGRHVPISRLSKCVRYALNLLVEPPSKPREPHRPLTEETQALAEEILFHFVCKGGDATVFA